MNIHGRSLGGWEGEATSGTSIRIRRAPGSPELWIAKAPRDVTLKKLNTSQWVTRLLFVRGDILWHGRDGRRRRSMTTTSTLSSPRRPATDLRILSVRCPPLLFPLLHCHMLHHFLSPPSSGEGGFFLKFRRILIPTTNPFGTLWSMDYNRRRVVIFFHPHKNRAQMGYMGYKSVCDYRISPKADAKP